MRNWKKLSQGYTLSTQVQSPDKMLYAGPVYAVSSWNETGPFDVLPYHIHFISIIRKAIILHKADGSEEKIPLDTGIIKVADNVINIYIGISFLHLKQ